MDERIYPLLEDAGKQCLRLKEQLRQEYDEAGMYLGGEILEAYRCVMDGLAEEMANLQSQIRRMQGQ